MSEQTTIGLESAINPESIDGIHNAVARALEEDLYRKHIGRFKMWEASGNFSLEPHYGDRKPLIAVDHYHLNLVPNEEVPGFDGIPNLVDVVYNRNRSPKTEHRFEISVEYWKNGDRRFGVENNVFCFDRVKRKLVSYEHRKGQITQETVQWVYDQLRAA